MLVRAVTMKFLTRHMLLRFSLQSLFCRVLLFSLPKMVQWGKSIDGVPDG